LCVDAPQRDTLRFDLVDHVLLVVSADMPPGEADWARLRTIREANRERIRMALVVAQPRSAPSAAQRAELAAFMRSTGSGLAVITDSALVRGLGLAMSMLGLKVRAYAPSDLSSALDFCGVPEPRRADLRRLIDALKAQLARRAESASPAQLPR
jgi:hypothetical protein